MLYIGLDDTDILGTPGTGRLARDMATLLAGEYAMGGIVRQQLFYDPRVPFTKNNSSACILLENGASAHAGAIAERVRTFMREHFQPGSDPGLCVSAVAPPECIAFGHRAQRELVTQAEARALAAAHGIYLEGLGGTEDGVIGALAAIGLTASGDDGRYILVGRSRELHGLQPVTALLEAGIAAVQLESGEPVTEGWVLADLLRPARRGGRPVAVVTWSVEDRCWLPLKLD